MSFINKWLILQPQRKVGRVIECAGLEIRYTPCGYRGFESLTFRAGKRTWEGAFFYTESEGSRAEAAPSPAGRCAKSAGESAAAIFPSAKENAPAMVRFSFTESEGSRTASVRSVRSVFFYHGLFGLNDKLTITITKTKTKKICVICLKKLTIINYQLSTINYQLPWSARRVATTNRAEVYSNRAETKSNRAETDYLRAIK